MATTVGQIARDRPRGRAYYTGMAIAFIVLVLAGFSQRYYTALGAAEPLALVVHLHVAAFAAWFVLLLAQTTLVAAERTDLHRRLGLCVVALAPLMVLSGTLTAVHGAANGWNPGGAFVNPLAFLALGLADIVLFAGFVTAGFIQRRSPDVHKRLMMLACVTLLWPAITRLPAGAGTRSVAPLEIIALFGLLALFAFAGPIYDFVSRRRVRLFELCGGLLIVASRLIARGVSRTDAWQSFAAWLVGVATGFACVSVAVRMTMLRLLLAAAALGTAALPATAQPSAPRPPVIDVHVHSTNTTPAEQLERMKALNIRFILLSSLASQLPEWASALDETRYSPSVTLPCPGGKAPFVDRRCWEGTADYPDLAWVRAEVQAGRLKGLGEAVPQYIGAAPNAARLTPYWQLAEELDLPVAIHMGPGPPFAAYDESPLPFTFPEYRMAAGDPLLLEEVLLAHKKLRILVMHAGWPFRDSMLALLYAHPNVYVDVGALQAEFMVPRASYYAHLKSIVDAGFGKRIVFGSDFPPQVAAGIDAIMTADFLNAEQKADILCNNAARFLRLDAATCTP